MIVYEERGVCFLFRWRGSTLFKAMAVAMPSALLAGTLRFYENKQGLFGKLGIDDYMQHSHIWNILTGAVFLLIGFRTSQAYGRFWEGVTLVYQMRAEWFDACSNAIAFSKSARDAEKMIIFQQTLIRLMSFMHGAALQEIKELGNEDFDVIDVQGLDADTIDYLRHCKVTGVNRVEVLMHLVHVLITDSITSRVLAVPAPITTRVYQTLSRGLVNLQNARKIGDVPFPFPYAQLIALLLLIHAVLTPVVVATFVTNAFWAAAINLLPVLGLWSMNFTAVELEQPFGDDDNDLPMRMMQTEMNQSLFMLLDVRAQKTPTCQKGTTGDPRWKKRKSRTDFLDLEKWQSSAAPEIRAPVERLYDAMASMVSLSFRRKRRPSTCSSNNSTLSGSETSADDGAFADDDGGQSLVAVSRRCRRLKSNDKKVNVTDLLDDVALRCASSKESPLPMAAGMESLVGHMTTSPLGDDPADLDCSVDDDGDVVTPPGPIDEVRISVLDETAKAIAQSLHAVAAESVEKVCAPNYVDDHRACDTAADGPSHVLDNAALYSRAPRTPPAICRDAELARALQCFDAGDDSPPLTSTPRTEGLVSPSRS